MLSRVCITAATPSVWVHLCPLSIYVFCADLFDSYRQVSALRGDEPEWNEWKKII